MNASVRIISTQGSYASWKTYILSENKKGQKVDFKSIKKNTSTPSVRHNVVKYLE